MLRHLMYSSYERDRDSCPADCPFEADRLSIRDSPSHWHEHTRPTRISPVILSSGPGTPPLSARAPSAPFHQSPGCAFIVFLPCSAAVRLPLLAGHPRYEQFIVRVVQKHPAPRGPRDSSRDTRPPRILPSDVLPCGTPFQKGIPRSSPHYDLSD